MSMKYTKIALSVCSVSTAFLLSACGGGSSTNTAMVIGTITDSPVHNLPYTCNPSNISGMTNQLGEYGCDEGDNVSFKLGSTILGPIKAKDHDLLTPYKLFPGEYDKAIKLAQLLQSLDDDGDYTERITLDPEKLKELITVNLDFGSSTFEEDAQRLLDEANLTLVDAATAEEHLQSSDTEKPIVTLVGDTEVTIEVGSSYRDAGVTAYDKFEGYLTPTISGKVDTAVPGTYKKTFTATDSAGNSASVTRTIKVVDSESPVVRLNGDESITIYVGDSYTDAGATATDNVDGALIPVKSGNVDTATPGSYTVTWTATDSSNNIGTATRTVVVVQKVVEDTVAPEISLEGENPMYLFEDDAFTDPGATAFDDVDGDVAVSVSGTVDNTTAGTYTLTYSAKDRAGNTATATRTVNVLKCENYNPITGECVDPIPSGDEVAPEISLEGENPMYLFEDDAFTDPGATAVDDVDGDVAVSVSGTVDNTTAGTYTLRYSAKDAAGNTATATRTVNVLKCENYNPITGECVDPIPSGDEVAPVVTLLGDATVHVDGNSTYEDAGATASDDLDGDLVPVMTQNNVNTAVADTYSVRWSATDSAGNEGSATRTVIVDPEQNSGECMSEVYNPITGECIES
jgi:hypothetical protein